ncbi:MAG TPA: PQQ-binding-like beta-propeller repeat protein [Magnetospirillaceae bacterium]|nr:PQQ-binding-like beta-propeller repeat protein [Magnetospirillaceae bacterium]
MTNKSYDGARYVTLDQITRKNVATLKPVCTYDSGLQVQAQSTPLLYKDRFYLTAGQFTVAVDAKSSSAFDPKRSIAVAPMVDWCGTVSHEAAAPVHQTATHFYGGKIDQDPIDNARGDLAAIDVASGTVVWKTEMAAPMLANVTMTSSGLTFAGDLKGTLYAVDSDSGDILLSYPLGASAGGGLFTYQLGQKQYVTALSGSVSAFFGGGDASVKLTVLALP